MCPSMQAAATWRFSQRSPTAAPISTPPACATVMSVMTSEACASE